MTPAHETQVRLEDNVAAALALRESTREELRLDLGVSRTTLGRALSGLIDAGYVRACVRSGAARRAGRPVETLCVDRRRAYAAGIDVTRSGGSGVVVNRLGDEVATATFQPGADESFAESAIRLSALLRQHAVAAGINCDHLYRVGVGVPIPVKPDEDGGPDTPAGIARAIAHQWAAPVLIDNSVRMAAVGEAIGHPGGLIYVGLNYGVGACVLINSRPVRGRASMAGELGHLPVPGHNERCYCGQRGCLETVVGLEALCGRLRVAAPAEFVLAYKAGDSRAQEALADVADALGFALAPLVLCLSPEQVVVGGELPYLLPQVVDDIAASLNKRIPPVLQWEVPLRLAQRDVTGRALGALAAVMNDREVAAPQ